MTKLLLIGLGGALGSIARYLLGGWIQRGTIPIETLVINVTGCLAIGFLATLFTGPSALREEYRVAILVGVLGGYTTFSTFGFDTFKLINEHQYWYAALNVLLSNVLGLGAVWLGARLAEHWFGA